LALRLAVIGRGSIGLTTLFYLHKVGFKDITIYGNTSQSHAASVAAGAMLNVVSEVDTFNYGSALVSWKLLNKRRLLDMWSDLMTQLVSLRIINNSLLYGKGTQIVLNESSSNLVEECSYNSMIEAYKSLLTSSHNSDTQSKGNFLIPDEQSVDSLAYLSALERYASQYCITINCDIDSIHPKGRNVLLKDSIGIVREYDFVILAAGSWSQSIIERSPSLPRPRRSSYYGVGSALLFRSELEFVDVLTVDRIYRTPNRGGTCGIHTVQRTSSLYVGASSVITDVPLRSPRASSLQTLLQGSQDIVGVKSIQLSCDVVTGYRPVTDDAYPIIGNLCDNVFCCYGTKRDGFTWAPYYGFNLAHQLQKSSTSRTLPQWEQLLALTNPFRELTSAGSPNDCITNYVNNKIAESAQHGKILTSQEKQSLNRIAVLAHDKVEKAVRKSIGLQPELINMIYYKQSSF
jgi:glycine/D-amino acid oxidase-like deaminating enzyme